MKTEGKGNDRGGVQVEMAGHAEERSNGRQMEEEWVQDRDKKLCNYQPPRTGEGGKR